MRGRANLDWRNSTATVDLERVRMLFDDLEQKEQLIGLLDGVRDAQGVRIFIGAETKLFSLSGSALIAAPYMSGRQKVLGAIGVIGGRPGSITPGSFLWWTTPPRRSGE